MMGPCRRAILFLTVSCLGSVCYAAEKPADPFVGNWKHTSGKMTLRIEAKRLDFLSGDGFLSLHANYIITRDYTIYGLITDVEGDGLLLSVLMVKVAVPFSFRVRAEEGALVVRDLKMGHDSLKQYIPEGIYKVDDKPETKGERKK